VARDWTGSSGYKASGTFWHSSALDGTGIITSSSITSFHLDVFSGSSPLFSWDLSDGTSDGNYRFSFNTTAFDIVNGGSYPDAADAVSLGYSTDAGRLYCGTAGCGLNCAFLGAREVSEVQFAFRRVDGTVPEPASLALLGAAFGAAGLARRRHKA
jgi:hypothetical protein